MPHQNLGSAFLENVDSLGDKTCMRFFQDGRWQDWSWTQVGDMARRVAAGLIASGIEPGDRVSILSENRPEWVLADLGAILAGAIVVPIYSSMTSREVAYHLSHSGAVLVFAENEGQVAKIEAAKDQLPDVGTVVVMQGGLEGDSTVSWNEFIDPGRTDSFLGQVDHRAAGPGPDTPITIVYTSGTTGPPKGAVLTHGNVMATLDATLEIVPNFDEIQTMFCYLPLAHMLERMGGHWLPLYKGRMIAQARSLDTIADDLKTLRPNMATGVPRVFEKTYARIVGRVETGSALKKKLFNWAIGVGAKKSRLIANHQPLPMGLKIKSELAHSLVFNKLHQALGGRLVYFISGGAPLGKEIAEFFHAAGILILEGWGATETTAPTTINYPQDFRFGSVGRPLPGVDVKVAADGELLVKGLNIFEGYYRDEKATAAAFTPDGYWLTGDVGYQDDDGFFYITDRKKEIIVTAAGKNVPPANIENRVKQRKTISNCLVHGDRRKYLTALVTIDAEAVVAALPELAGLDYADLANHPQVEKMVNEDMERVNGGLASFETIKYYNILPQDFAVETGELTQTLKLKRRVIQKRYGALLDDMYPTEPKVGSQ